MAVAQQTRRTFRRSPHLVCYWRGGSLVLHNYATGVIAEASALVCEVLDFCDGWRTTAAIRRHLPDSTPELTRQLIERLVSLTFLRRSGIAPDPRERAMEGFERWNPAAGFFHTATKDVPFASAREASRALERQALVWPMPEPVKRYRTVAPVALPKPAMDGELTRVLLARRTWRRFSKSPVTLEELATVLGLTLGVQQWVTAGGRELPLKTFPSGGARHPIEGYVVARNVRGLDAGIYHYDSAGHRLDRLRAGATSADIRRYLPQSRHFAGASALVLFTAVFERQLWRYPYARAYRAALVEAGHACQTFCLAATSLNLAPFSVMGLADSAIERDLGLDGIGESVLYAAGVGRPPARTSWAPLQRGTLPVRPNRALSRRRQ